MTSQRGQLRPDWGTLSGAFFFILIGGGFAAFGFYQLVTTWQFLSDAVPVEARVAENPESCDDDGCTWWPTMTFEDANGNEILRPTRHGSSSYGYSEGSELTVLVNPDYNYVRLPEADNLWLLGGAFAALGTLPFVLGFWLLFTHSFVRTSPD